MSLNNFHSSGYKDKAKKYANKAFWQLFAYFLNYFRFNKSPTL